MTENLTNWKQFRLKLNLGMLVSIIGVVSVVVWQGLMIRAQIDDNSDAVDEMVYAIEDLAGAVSLANELDNRTTVLFGEIDSLRDQYQDQADVWVEISTQAEQIDTIRAEARILRQDIESTWNQQNEFRMEVVGQVGEFESARNSLTDLQWKVDDLDRRVAEQFGVDLGSEHQDYGWQITDLVRQVAELQGRMNSANDMEWKVDDLERQLNEVKDSVGYLLMVAEQSYWNVN
jgi:chromosome segregation ATPase|tara:strand:- start:427 stop:1122 length:696 start_codon:yes stop_codon:yes gene_type:complete